MRAESEFEGQCVKDLRALGYLVYTHADSPRNRKNSRSDSGYPDITFAGRGRVGFIECKMPKNKRGDPESLSNDQDKWRDAIQGSQTQPFKLFRGFANFNPVWAVATPDNWQSLLDELA